MDPVQQGYPLQSLVHQRAPLGVADLLPRHAEPLPDALRESWPPQLLATDEKGWFRFQRLYDIARSVLRTEDDVRRLVREAAEDDRAEAGSRVPAGMIR